MQHVKTPVWKARAYVVDVVTRRKVASIHAVAETPTVARTVGKECAWAIENAGRYACTEPELYFLRHGGRTSDRVTVTFLAEEET